MTKVSYLGSFPGEKGKQKTKGKKTFLKKGLINHVICSGIRKAQLVLTSDQISKRIDGKRSMYLLFFKINLFIYLFIFGRVGSSLLPVSFLQLRRAGPTLCCGVRASHCGGFSCCGARVVGARAQQLWLAGSTAQAQ